MPTDSFTSSAAVVTAADARPNAVWSLAALGAAVTSAPPPVPYKLNVLGEIDKMSIPVADFPGP